MSFNTEILADSPKGYWRLNETSGTIVNDASGNGVTGGYAGSYTLGQTGLADDSDLAVLFSSGRANFDNAVPLRITGEITVAAIIKPVALPSNGVQMTLVSKGYANDKEAYHLRLYRTAGGQLQLHFVTYDNPTAYGIEANISMTAGETYFIVGRHKDGLRSVWVNGAKVGESSAAQGAFLNTARVGIGAYDNLDSWVHPFNGTIDEVAIFDTGLSDARIGAYWAALDGGSPPAEDIELVSASVQPNGVDVLANFNGAVSGAVLNDFVVQAGGKLIPLLSVSGNGTSTLTFRIARSWIISGESVKFSYVGTGLTGATTPARATVTATNSSTVSAKKRRYVDREFGGFMHMTAAAYGIPATATLEQIQTFNPSEFDMNQMLDAYVSAGMKYAILTTKHDCGFCLWPTLSGGYNIAQTPWYGTTGIDIVKAFTDGCRARGLGVGLYLNFYDPWWENVRPGADGGYGSGFVSFISTQITELLSNYGQIDILWIDSWHYGGELGYGNIPYATIQGLVNGLQPNCAMVNNARGSETYSEVAITEGSGAPDSPPAESNLMPLEFCETPLADASGPPYHWHYDVTAYESNLRPALETAQKLKSVNRGRGCYLLNFPPKPNGKLSDGLVAYLASIGQIIGQQGGPKFPARTNVKNGVDRGDGETGTYAASGGSGNAIAGLI